MVVMQSSVSFELQGNKMYRIWDFSAEQVYQAVPLLPNIPKVPDKNPDRDTAFPDCEDLLISFLGCDAM
jgi:hypothetical protein